MKLYFSIQTVVSTLSQCFNLKIALLLLLFAVGLISFGQVVWIKTKAELAQYLISEAWEKSTDTKPLKPWPWADTVPVAKLQLPNQEQPMIALQGLEGNSLAFGPGMIEVEREGNADNLVLIAGHNDTHFRVLDQVAVRQVVKLQRSKGSLIGYQIQSTRIVDSRVEPLVAGDNEDLLLITCYPFNSLQSNGPLRYVVAAKRITEDTESWVDTQQVARTRLYL